MIPINEYILSKGKSAPLNQIDAEFAKRWDHFCKDIKWEDLAPMVVIALDNTGISADELMDEMSRHKDPDDYMNLYDNDQLEYCTFEKELNRILEDNGYDEDDIVNILDRFMMLGYDALDSIE